MRRTDRQRDAAFAWEVFDRAPYAVLSVRDGEGGYGIPVSPARVGERIYFHGAAAGKKPQCLARWPEATLTAAEVLGPERFSVRYRSAVIRGRVVPVEDGAEKIEALRAITRRHCPEDLTGFDAYAPPILKGTCVWRMDVSEITGKERMPG